MEELKAIARSIGERIIQDIPVFGRVGGLATVTERRTESGKRQRLPYAEVLGEGKHDFIFPDSGQVAVGFFETEPASFLRKLSVGSTYRARMKFLYWFNTEKVLPENFDMCAAAIRAVTFAQVANARIMPRGFSGDGVFSRYDYRAELLPCMHPFRCGSVSFDVIFLSYCAPIPTVSTAEC